MYWFSCHNQLISSDHKNLETQGQWLTLIFWVVWISLTRIHLCVVLHLHAILTPKSEKKRDSIKDICLKSLECLRAWESFCAESFCYFKKCLIIAANATSKLFLVLKMQNTFLKKYKEILCISICCNVSMSQFSLRHVFSFWMTIHIIIPKPQTIIEATKQMDSQLLPLDNQKDKDTNFSVFVFVWVYYYYLLLMSHAIWTWFWKFSKKEYIKKNKLLFLVIDPIFIVTMLFRNNYLFQILVWMNKVFE